MPRYKDPSLTCRPSNKIPRAIDPKNIKRSIDPAVLDLIDIIFGTRLITTSDI